MKKKKIVTSDEIHWETAKHVHFRDFDKQSLYALNQCYNMFCVVLIDCWCQVQNVIFRFPLKYILVTENFCVYYCVCIEGILKHQGHNKSITVKILKFWAKKKVECAKV